MRPPTPLLIVAMLLAACGGAEPTATSASSSATPTSSTATSTSSTVPKTTATEQPTTTSTANTTTTSTTLPGEIVDFGPAEGDTLMVIGVRYDDVLNVRAGPGVGFDIVETLEPDDLDVNAMGETRQIPGAFWISVDVDGTVGWVNMRYVGFEGSTDDLTHVVVEEIGYPTSDTMAELGLIVARTFASDDPKSDIVLVVDESVGDLGEVTYDIIGLGDDAVLGVRAHVFGQPSDEGFGLMSVEVTTICGRGITEDGLCP